MRCRFTELRSLVIEVLERVVSPEDRSRVFLFAPEPVFASVDTKLLEHVVVSLLANALDSAHESCSVVMRLEERDEAAWLSVTDTPSAEASEKSGVSEAIIEAHGGTLEGSSFALPLGTAPARQPRLAGFHALLIGSGLPHVRDLLAMLAAEGMTAIPATTRSDALRAVRTRKPDAVVADFDMPDGPGVLAELRSRLPHTLIALVTDRSSTRVLSREPIILVNPIDAGELFAVIARRLATSDRDL